MGAGVGIFDRRLDDQDRDTSEPAVGLPSQHAAHPLDHLAPRSAGPDDDGEVGGGDVDALIEHPRRADDAHDPGCEALEDVGAHAAGQSRVDDPGGDAGVGEPEGSALAGGNALGEHDRSVGNPDHRRQFPQRVTLARGLGEQAPPLGGGLPILASEPRRLVVPRAVGQRVDLTMNAPYGSRGNP